MLGPLLEKTVAANPKVTLVKLNVDEANELAAKYKVKGVMIVIDAWTKDGIYLDCCFAYSGCFP